MDDRLKESISALIDDETNELELQRVFSHADKDELLDTWKSYHSIRAVLQYEQEDSFAIDISQSVSDTIAQEAPLTLNTDLNSTLADNSAHINGLSLPLNSSELQSPSLGQTAEKSASPDDAGPKMLAKFSGGLAIAASIFIAFVFVLQNGVEGGRSGLQDKLLASDTTSLSSLHGAGLQTVSTLSATSEGADALKKQPKIMVEFTEEHARRFNEYLLRHAEYSVASSHAGMIPLVRVASVNAVGI
jgi:sigma-E factor negative regulatory protein RseA